MPESTSTLVRQGFGQPWQERLPLPASDAMSQEQRDAAQALIDGPRKGVYGPFIALLRSPQLLDRVGKLGEYLRFESVLSPRIRELVTCACARHLSNQFEWVMHAPLALKAGVAPSTIDSLAAGSRPRNLPSDEESALDFARELLATQGVSDASYQAALDLFGEQGVVELTTLLGYFTMVSWVLNVARTPTHAQGPAAALAAFPL
jgi:4-carboxymuconolactone decarboxylase